eukprot:TRINITY_DN10796_c0_g1_i1.p1 TRINITY_DN10796_c0_g1~~TRINITY_DN10796_c0_g1_i1.p1  ORF type:complete len:142 (-),score=31.00 TRINITY_DN10796_c0_g1_i1:2-427(-)
MKPPSGNSRSAAVAAAMRELNKVSKSFLEEGSQDMVNLAKALRDQGRKSEAESVDKLAQNLLTVERGVEAKFNNHSTHRLHLTRIRNATRTNYPSGTRWALTIELSESKCSLVGCGESGTRSLLSLIHIRRCRRSTPSSIT